MEASKIELVFREMDLVFRMMERTPVRCEIGSIRWEKVPAMEDVIQSWQFWTDPLLKRALFMGTVSLTEKGIDEAVGFVANATRPYGGFTFVIG